MVRREETERDDGRGKMGSSSVDSAPSMQQSVGARVATSALYKRKGDKKKGGFVTWVRAEETSRKDGKGRRRSVGAQEHR